MLRLELGQGPQLRQALATSLVISAAIALAIAIAMRNSCASELPRLTVVPFVGWAMRNTFLSLIGVPSHELCRKSGKPSAANTKRRKPHSDTCLHSSAARPHRRASALDRRALARTGPKPTLIEWDNDVPAWATLFAEAQRADAVIADAVLDDESPARRRSNRMAV